MYPIPMGQSQQPSLIMTGCSPQLLFFKTNDIMVHLAERKLLFKCNSKDKIGWAFKSKHRYSGAK